MLHGVNDSDADARELVRLLQGIPAKVNLIPFNPWPGSPYACSSNNRIRAFARDRRGRRPCLAGAHAARPRHPRRLRPAQDREPAPACPRCTTRPERVRLMRRFLVGLLATIGAFVVVARTRAAAFFSGG